MGRRRYIHDLVLQRIELLDELALESVRRGDLELARSAGRIIRRLYLRNKVKVGVELKRRYCKRCFTPLVPGLTSRVRVRGRGRSVVRVTTCLSCGEVYRLELGRRR